jgi:hypothetical protein
MSTLVLVLLVVLTSTALAVLADVRPAAACSCVGIDDEEALTLADVAFVGEVRSVDFPDSGYSAAEATVWFDVTQVYAGEAYADQPVQTAQDSASCGIELRHLDGPVLVFAERTDGGRDLAGQLLRAGLCGGTRETSNAPVPTDWVAARPIDGVAATPVDGSGASGSESSVVPIVVAVAAIALVAGLASALVINRSRRNGL